MFRKGDFDTPEPDPDLVRLPHFNHALSDTLASVERRSRSLATVSSKCPRGQLRPNAGSRHDMRSCTMPSR